MTILRRAACGALLSASLLSCASLAAAQEAPYNTSGGALLDEQACYDVQHYDLAIEVLPETRSIEGKLTMTAKVVQPSKEIALHLDTELDVRSVRGGGDTLEPIEFERHGQVVYMETAASMADAGSTFRIEVSYGGKPRIAPNPPWDGGFTWKKAKGGAPWIATTCQGEGADIWWPCKDHPSDKPESFDLHVTVPEGLVCATNGRRLSSETKDKKTTSHWRVTTPIANYTVALNIGPYVELSRTVKSVAGDEYPVQFWVLPENEEKGKAFMDEIVEHLAFFEEFCGPYPFRGDKYGVVETPHLGMEHQSIIAYGNRYKGDPNFDYDWLHHHELAHEWWANLVTASDWADFWIHEGIGTYMQPLYLEQKFGREAYDKKMRLDLLRVLNRGPVAPKGPRTTDSIYFAQDGTDAPGIDIYMKGSWICHSLRWLLGDESFFKVLRRWAYPDPALEKTTDGSAVRFADTEQMREIAEEVSGVELDWFFQAYLRTAALPELVETREGGTLKLEWKLPGGGPFPMPVEVRIGDELRRIEMPNGKAELEVGDAKVKVDPARRVLKERG